jgi:hypothetical protein
MNKLPLVLRALHRAEVRLGRDLLAVSDRHWSDHETSHVARELAQWPRIHVERLAEAAARRGKRLTAEPRWSFPLIPELSRRSSVLLGRRPEPALLLLQDLRRLHRRASATSLDWELLAQSAQAMQEQDLVELSSECHPQVLRIMRWANAQLKVLSPQAIAG